MNKSIIAVAFCILLAGCQTTQNVVQTKIHVAVPDSALFECPEIKSMPSVKGLTDVKVAKLLLELYKNNKTCKNSIDAIKQFLEEAQKTIEN